MKILKALYQNSRLVLFKPGVGSVLRQAVRSRPTWRSCHLILGIAGGLILLLAGAGARAALLHIPAVTAAASAAAVRQLLVQIGD
jgi:hypothetical protein